MLPFTVVILVLSSSSAKVFSLLEADRFVGDEATCELLEFMPESFIARRPGFPFPLRPTGRTVPKSHKSSSSLFREGEPSSASSSS